MKNLNNPPCAGQSWLFDSTNVNDHLIAKEMCDHCPARLDCHQELVEEYKRMPGGTPTGTWAGLLVGKGRRRLVEVSA